MKILRQLEERRPFYEVADAILTLDGVLLWNEDPSDGRVPIVDGSKPQDQTFAAVFAVSPQNLLRLRQGLGRHVKSTNMGESHARIIHRRSRTGGTLSSALRFADAMDLRPAVAELTGRGVEPVVIDRREAGATRELPVE